MVENHPANPTIDRNLLEQMPEELKDWTASRIHEGENNQSFCVDLKRRVGLSVSPNEQKIA